MAQFVALQVGRQPHYHPRNHASEEEVSDDEAFNPFGDYPLRGIMEREFIPNNRDSYLEVALKIDIPEFRGGLAAEDFLDWVNTIEDILEFKEVSEEKGVPLWLLDFEVGWLHGGSKPDSLEINKKKIEDQSVEEIEEAHEGCFLPHNYSR